MSEMTSHKIETLTTARLWSNKCPANQEMISKIHVNPITKNICGKMPTSRKTFAEKCRPHHEKKFAEKCHHPKKHLRKNANIAKKHLRKNVTIAKNICGKMSPSQKTSVEKCHHRKKHLWKNVNIKKNIKNICGKCLHTKTSSEKCQRQTVVREIVERQDVETNIENIELI
jgi:hypothetical protein